MPHQIITLSGVSNSGKSTVLRKLIKKLIVGELEDKPYDVRVILNICDKEIAISTQGDEEDIIKKFLSNPLVEKCPIKILPTKAYGKTVDAIFNELVRILDCSNPIATILHKF